MRRTIALLLTLIMLSASVMVSCSEASDKSGQESTANAGDTSAAEETEANILDGLNFNGQDFRIQMSATSISSNAYMEGTGESTGDVALDAAYERNLAVSDRLNVNLVYTDTDYNWDTVTKNTRVLVLAGDDEFELIVNDQIGLATAAVEKLFVNLYDCDYFDFDQSYWWYDYMKDLTIGNKYMYLLVGDYFIDVLRKSHVIYYNRDLYSGYYDDPDALYQMVNDGSWTYDALIEKISGCYSDLDGNGKVSKDDQFGLVIAGVGGSIFPYEYAADTSFITRDEDGIPSITMNNEKSDLLYQKIYAVYYNDATYTNFEENTQALYSKFSGNGTVFLSTITIGAFDQFRDMEDDIGILPYPKLDEEQTSYRTCIHDTAEIGAIPLTCQNTDFASAVIQALCEESGNTMIPAYYETALKIKYVRDNYSAQMIDLIHDGIQGLFPLVYGASYANNIFTWAFLEPLQKKQEAWVSSYESRADAAMTQFQTLIDAYTAE